MWNKEQLLAVTKNPNVRLLCVASASFGLGAAGAHTLTKRKYETLIETEAEELRQMYFEKEQNLLSEMAKEHREGDILTSVPEKPPLTELIKDYKSDNDERPTNYSEMSTATDQELEQLVEEELKIEVKRTEVNIFAGDLEEFNQELEEAWREENPDSPFIISKEEFLENDPEYNQVTITYYEDDDVLADEQDRPVDNQVQLVGNDALEKFGYGSGDNNIVYVRNPNLDIDLEVLRSTNSYAATVLGFKHSDRRTPRKFRDSDD